MTAVLDPPRTGPDHAVEDEAGKRFYLFPGDDTRYWSVTTATSVFFKDALTIWSAMLAAQSAFDELPTLIASVRVKPCNRTYYKCKHDWREPHTAECACRRCQPCMTKWLVDRHHAKRDNRADEGKRSHNVIQWWAEHDGEWIGYADDIAPYIEAFKALVAEYGLTPASWVLTEVTVVNRAAEYAGTADGIIRFDARATPAAADLVARLLSKNTGEKITAEDAAARGLTVDVLVDFKTQDKPVEKEKFYPDQTWQLAAYRWAPVYRIKGTNIEPDMPETDGAALIHLRPDGATVRLVKAGEGEYEIFLCALRIFRWTIEEGTAAVSTRTFPLPKPTKTAVPRKAAAKTTAPAATTATAAAPAKKATPTKTAAATLPAAPAVSRAQRITSPRTYAELSGARLTDDDIPF